MVSIFYHIKKKKKEYSAKPKSTKFEQNFAAIGTFFFLFHSEDSAIV